MMALSPGQQLAFEQLKNIIDRSDGALEIIGDVEEGTDGTFIQIPLSLATAEYRTEVGLPFRDRERLSLVVYSDFPFRKPQLSFTHKRFIGQPHVQWGSYICLYQSVETEYQPGDGMFGFFERVNIWMVAAGQGQLDPENAPLHPPVSYATSATQIVVKVDTPAQREGEAYWLGRADLKKVRDTRFDVVDWTQLDDWDGAAVDHPIAVAVLLEHPIATEYPTRVFDLINLVSNAGLPFSMLYRLLRLLSLLTNEGEPGRIVFGAPMRRKAEGESLKPHLTVWEVAPEPLTGLRAVIQSKDADEASKNAVFKWLAESAVTWCQVLEDRPEIVHRRDYSAAASILAGKRVMLLGCGALGSALGAMIARAGASSLCVVDSGIVRPGLLVRQRYSDNDIGYTKASALKVNLAALGLPCAISSETWNLAEGALTRFTHADWDLVIDATATPSVHHRIERELATEGLAMPLISLSVSASASHGCVVVKMPDYPGGPHGIARQAKLSAFARDADNALVKAFWPAREDIKVFQPEPGCSAPTFVGSAADIDHHSAGLLNIGLLRIMTLSAEMASVDLVAGSWIDGLRNTPTRLSYSFAGYTQARDRRHGYSVVQSPIASRGITTELARIARTRSDRVETGGLLFGEVDDSHRQIWIDSVSGPPSDSQASPIKFLCGTAGTPELAAFRAKASGGSSRFIGIWHTHPISRGNPSADDLTAMLKLLHFQEHSPRQVLMVIVGFAATNPTTSYYLYRRNEFQLIAVEDLADGGGP